ncbi:uncharacterized protein LOC130673241 [Microplitis mediator]|uniref:uncharacterized protein LOC130673241 n=1 Tax=Microplitis mediator TaxID=375433 RepID=UPI0025579D75|nr:uncharacterized protein LOC130673241 [Microplitis mediator]
MDVFDCMQWRTTKKLMSLLGAWPFQPVIQQKTLGALFYFIIQSIYVVEILKLRAVWGNLTETLDCLPIFVYHTMVQVKMSNFLLNLKKWVFNLQAKILLSKVKSDWESNLDDSEMNVLRNDERTHKIMMDIYSSGLSSVAIVYAVVPLVPIFLDIVIPLNETRPKNLPYPTEYFVDIEDNFYALYTHGLIVTPIAFFYFLTFDVFYAGLIQHACSMFTIIGRRLKNLTVDENIISIKKNSINEKNGIKSLVICIKMHKEILWFAQLLEENFSNYCFLLLGTIVLGLTTVGFQFVVLATEASEKIRCIWYATAQIIHLFFLSYFGQKLINHSEFIYESICTSKWYNYPKKMKLLIILMLMRGKIVSTITAGKIYIMSVENFSTVMKTSMSYFTVLTSVQLRKSLNLLVSLKSRYCRILSKRRFIVFFIKMEVFDCMQWRTTKKLMSALGAWPFQPVIQQKILGALFYFIIQSIYVLEILKLMVVWGNLTEILDCLPIFVYHTMVQVKMSNFLLNLKKWVFNLQAKILLSKVKSDWESNLDDSEMNVLRNNERFHKIMMDIYSSGLSSIAVSYAVVPLVPIFLDIVNPLNETRPKVLPFPTEYFVDIEKNFYALYTHALIVTPITFIYFLAFDSLYAGLVQHACSMFTIIGRRLEQLTVDENISIEKNSMNEENGLKSLVICIKMHKEILWFAELLEENFSNHFFLLLGTIVLGLTFIGFQFVVLATEAGEKIRCVWCGTGQIIHLFFLSYFGQKLINHSEFIYKSICTAKWYNYSKKMKLLIIMMLMRGKEVSTITAGKIYIMSVENFSTVMKTSMSYFTVLTSVQ